MSTMFEKLKLKNVTKIKNQSKWKCGGKKAGYDFLK